MAFACVPISPHALPTWGLTSHEEEKPCHILHKASVPAAAQHTDDPAEEDDGHRHAHEASRHSAQVCGEAGRQQSASEPGCQGREGRGGCGRGKKQPAQLRQADTTKGPGERWREPPIDSVPMRINTGQLDSHGHERSLGCSSHLSIITLAQAWCCSSHATNATC